MTYLAQAGPALPPFEFILAALLVIFFAIGIHEFAHAKVADMAGDPTPGMYGRVTLNLFKHFELMGTILIIITTLVGVGIGWGKPVPMDPSKMKNPRWDHFAAVAAGPMSNLLQAVVFAILMRSYVLVAGIAGISPSTFVFIFLFLGVTINVSLFLFNLLPIGMLDGMWLVSSFLPDPMRLGWVRFNLSFGSFLFIGLILMGQLGGTSVFGTILRPASRTLFRLLTGVDADIW